MHHEHEIAELINANFIEFEDIELLELLLGMFMAQDQSEEVSRICQRRFGSLSDFISSSPQVLQRAGLSPQIILTIKLIQVISERMIDPMAKTRAMDVSHLIQSNN